VEVQDQIENLTKTFESSQFISSPLYTESWVRSFVNYVNRNQEELNVTIDTKESFLQTLNDVRFKTLQRQLTSDRLCTSFICILAMAVQTKSILAGRQV